MPQVQEFDINNSHQNAENTPVPPEHQMTRRTFSGLLVGAGTGYVISETLMPGSLSRDLPNLITNTGIKTLAGPDFVYSRDPKLSTFEQLNIEDVENLYLEVGPDDMGLSEFTFLLQNLTSCAVCLRGEKVDHHADYVNSVGKLCKTIKILSDMHKVDYSTVLEMFIISGENTTPNAYKDEVQQEVVRRAVKRGFMATPDLAMYYAFKKAKEMNLDPLTSARLLGPATYGIHDMEMVEIATAVMSDSSMFERFKKQYPAEAVNLQNVKAAHTDLAVVKAEYTDNANLLTQDSAFLEIIKNPNNIRSLLTNISTGELNPYQLFKTTHIWAEFCTTSRGDNGGFIFPTKEIQQAAIENAVYFYQKNPLRLLSDQSENPLLLNLLMNVQRQGIDTKALVASFIKLKAGVRKTMAIEREAEPRIAGRDKDIGFQAITGVAYAAYKIHQGEEAVLQLRKGFGIETNRKPDRDEIVFMANAFREVSPPFELAERDCPTYADVPYADFRKMAAKFIEAAYPYYLAGAKSGMLPPKYVSIGGQGLLELYLKISSPENLSRTKLQLLQPQKDIYFGVTSNPSWPRAAGTQYNIASCRINDANSHTRNKQQVKENRQVKQVGAV